MSDQFRNTLGLIQQLLIWVIMIFWTYQLIISIASLFKIKEKKILFNKNHKFLVIIPAHNEQAVVGQLVQSLQEQTYPKEMFDVYVIADNCTDNTAEIARKSGATVYERFDETKKTKGYALNWFLNKMMEEKKSYDALIIFDADNIVEKHFVEIMNKKLCQGETLVQGYRDIKNPEDTWVSGGYAIFYWMMNRLYHLARYNVGLSPLINGTAFMVKWELLIPSGWNTTTLTEDIEFSLINIAKGTKLGWAKDAIVYDEQPLTFKQSWTQRERWTVGHLQCVKGYTKDLATAVVKEKTLMNFDAFLYILGIPILLLTLLLLVVNTIFFMMGEMSLQDLMLNYGQYLFSTFIVPIFVAIFIILVDGRKLKPMLKAVFLFPIFMGSWILINLKSLIKPNTKWVKIEHTKSVSIDEMNKK